MAALGPPVVRYDFAAANGIILAAQLGKARSSLPVVLRPAVAGGAELLEKP